MLQEGPWRNREVEIFAKMSAPNGLGSGLNLPWKGHLGSQSRQNFTPTSACEEEVNDQVSIRRLTMPKPDAHPLNAYPHDHHPTYHHDISLNHA